jgi:tRNA(fMet)-specific endonuclease VapC
MFLLDTDTCIDALRGLRSVVQKLRTLSPDDCSVSSVTAFELYSGTLLSANPERERRKVDEFLEEFTVIAFDRIAAKLAAGIRLNLRRKGSTIGAYDLLIAAEAVRTGCVLLTSNEREFGKIPDLRLESWR